MKYKYYCRTKSDSYVIDFLESKKVKYNTGTITNTLIFDIYSDIEQSEVLLEYIQNLNGTLITKSSVFSKEEMENANWYLFYVTRMGIDTSNVDYTYDAKCPYTTAYGMQRHRHLEQINSFVSKKTLKWNNKYNFCSLETGTMTKIFCSDYAKNAILQNGINGVDFMPLIKGDLKTKTPDISQLVFKNKLPLEAYKFVGEYYEDVCPFCGKINYIFKELNCDNIRLNTDIIPDNIDVFGSKITIGYGFGEEPIVVSKKFYNLITKEIKENPKHIIWYPIA